MVNFDFFNEISSIALAFKPKMAKMAKHSKI